MIPFCSWCWSPKKAIKIYCQQALKNQTTWGNQINADFLILFYDPLLRTGFQTTDVLQFLFGVAIILGAKVILKQVMQ